MPEAPHRLAVFGGTFDPPHVGHAALARAVLDEDCADAVVFVPAPRPPHKSGAVAPFVERAAMVRLLAAGEPRFEVSVLEARRPGPSYTVDTLRALRSERGAGVELRLVVGADSVWEIGAWREAPELFRLARFVVAPRPGFRLPGPGEVPEGLTEAQAETIRRSPVLSVRCPVRSRDVRRKIRRGEDVADLLPGAVLRHVEARGLYRGA